MRLEWQFWEFFLPLSILFPSKAPNLKTLLSFEITARREAARKNRSIVQNLFEGSAFEFGSSYIRLYYY